MMFYGNFTGDNNARFQQALATLSDIFGPIYAADNLIGLTRTAGFIQDKQFMDALIPYAKTQQEQSLLWRLHTLTWAAFNAAKLDGDFVECGVFKGFCSAVIMHFLEFDKLGKQYFLYDTYEGIPEEYNTENHPNQEYIDAKDTLYKEVCERFSGYKNAQVIKGTVPQSFEGTLPKKIAFAHIDMNSSRSEIEALEQIYPRLVTGGLIVFDDYGWTNYQAQKQKEDAFAKAHGQMILELPTGQGLLVKQN